MAKKLYKKAKNALSLFSKYWLMSRIFSSSFFFFFYLIGFKMFPRLEKPLKALHNPAQTAMTNHNNEFCEWTCLYAPLPRGWNMIWMEWKPFFENFIFKRNTSPRKGSSVTAWSAGRRSHVGLHSICLYVSLRFSKCLTVCLLYFRLPLRLRSRDFLTVLICRETHEYMQAGWNLMDSEWTLGAGTLGHFKHWDISLYQMKLLWSEYIACSIKQAT